MICIIKLDAIYEKGWQKILEIESIKTLIGNPDGVAAQYTKAAIGKWVYWLSGLYLIKRHPFTAWQYRVYWR